MSFHQEPDAQAGPSTQRHVIGQASRQTSRTGSEASLWSSADVPFFLDARRSSGAARSHSFGSSRLLSEGNASVGSQSGGAASRKGSHPLLDVDEAHDEPGPEWERRDVPAGPMSPRPSVDSNSFSLPRASIASRRSIGTSNAASSSPRQASLHRSSDSVGSSPRGFQHRKPVALQIQPIAYSSPLRAKSIQTPGNQPSPGAQSTIAPSLATSPVPSQDTDASADLPTPMTFKSTQSRSHRSRKDQGSSLYARAEQFFSAGYSMSTPPQTAHDFRSSDDDEFIMVSPDQNDSTPPGTRDPAAEGRPRPLHSFGATHARPAVARSPMSSWMAGEGIPPKSVRHVAGISRSEHNSPAPNFATLPGSPASRRLAPTAHSSPLQPAISLAHQDPASPTSLGRRDVASPLQRQVSPPSALDYQTDVGPRMRTLSTPRLHGDWLAEERSRFPHRKGSFCPEGSARPKDGMFSNGPPSSFRQGGINESAVSVSSSGDAPESPRSRLFNRTSRITTPNGKTPSQRSRNASTASLTQSMFKPPKSPARPKSKAGWSSYLSEGLTLYLDQTGKHECSIRMPYLSYDPFGTPESLVHATQLGQPPSTPKKNKLRPASSRETMENEVGVVNFARASDAEPASPIVFSAKEPAPILRHLGIGEDTQADLLTRQATLALSTNGIHQVSGFERSGRVAWQFKYEIDDSSYADVYGSVTSKSLTPLSFACSATLLDPTRARKARLLKMVRKGVSTNISSNLVDVSPGRTQPRDRSISANATVDSVSHRRLQGLMQSAGPAPIEEMPSVNGEPSLDPRRPSTRTNTSNGSVVRLDASVVRIPANLPATVVPFKLRPSFSSAQGPPPTTRKSENPVDVGAASFAPIPPHGSALGLMPSSIENARHPQVVPQLQGRRATSHGIPEISRRPRTAAEEIKWQYLERSASDDASSSAPLKQRNLSFSARPSSARDASHAVPEVRQIPPKVRLVNESKNFAAIKSQSRQHLRKAISTKALPGLPPRPVTAQNLSATNSQASASLLVELGFI